MPKVSVIMPAYNAEKYIKESIESILNQTFTDFEFIILNDCSRDTTEEIIRSFGDPRILYVKNEKNMGVALTLNRGLELAKGEYVARMDADDISLPERFARQVEFLENHPNVAVVAADVELFGAQNSVRSFSQTAEKLKTELLFSSCFAHPSVMMRTDVIRKLGGYDLSFEGVEDYHLWVRTAQTHGLASLPEVLLRYRMHPSQVTQTQSVGKREENIRRLKKMQLEPLGLGDAEDFEAFCHPEEDVAAFQRFAKVLLAKNKEKAIYDQKFLEVCLRAVSGRELDKMGFRQALAVSDRPVRYGIRRLKNRVKFEIRKLLTGHARRKQLKHKDFTILSNNCWGGMVYRKYDLPYLTPTAGLFFLGDDFVKFCADWQRYLKLELEFIPWEQSRFYPQIKDQKPYPVAKLGDIEVYFMHYPTAEEAEEKWKRRAARINPDRLIFKLSQRECCSKEDVQRFLALPHPNKICFSYDEVDGAIHIPELETLKGDEQYYVQANFDELAYLNSLD